jgi:hypothetical protein
LRFHAAIRSLHLDAAAVVSQLLGISLNSSFFGRSLDRHARRIDSQQIQTVAVIQMGRNQAQVRVQGSNEVLAHGETPARLERNASRPGRKRRFTAGVSGIDSEAAPNWSKISTSTSAALEEVGSGARRRVR